MLSILTVAPLFYATKMYIYSDLGLFIFLAFIPMPIKIEPTIQSIVAIGDKNHAAIKKATPTNIQVIIIPLLLPLGLDRHISNLDRLWC